MDHDLDSTAPTAENLLATSPTFESQLQNSVQNPFYALQLLAELGELTRKNLETLQLQQLLPPQTKPSQTKSSHLPTPSPKTPSLGDQTILDALQALRKSGRSFSKMPAHCATILKAPPR